MHIENIAEGGGQAGGARYREPLQLLTKSRRPLQISPEYLYCS